MTEEFNVIALDKCEEQPEQLFVFLYKDEDSDLLLETIGKMARDPELDFNLRDVVTVGRKIVELAYQKNQNAMDFE